MFILITLLQIYTLHVAEQYKAVNIDSAVFKNPSRAYLSHTCSVPSPCFLRIKVPLSGECTEQVRSKYGSGMELIGKKWLNL